MSDDEQPVAEPVQVLAMAADTADALLRLAASLGLDAVRIDLEGCSDKAGLLDIVGPGGYHDDLHAALTQVDWGATLANQPGRTETEETR